MLTIVAGEASSIRAIIGNTVGLVREICCNGFVSFSWWYVRLEQRILFEQNFVISLIEKAHSNSKITTISHIKHLLLIGDSSDKCPNGFPRLKVEIAVRKPSNQIYLTLGNDGSRPSIADTRIHQNSKRVIGVYEKSILCTHETCSDQAVVTTKESHLKSEE